MSAASQNLLWILVLNVWPSVSQWSIAAGWRSNMIKVNTAFLTADQYFDFVSDVTPFTDIWPPFNTYLYLTMDQFSDLGIPYRKVKADNPHLPSRFAQVSTENSGASKEHSHVTFTKYDTLRQIEQGTNNGMQSTTSSYTTQLVTTSQTQSPATTQSTLHRTSTVNEMKYNGLPSNPQSNHVSSPKLTIRNDTKSKNQGSVVSVNILKDSSQRNETKNNMGQVPGLKWNIRPRQLKISSRQTKTLAKNDIRNKTVHQNTSHFQAIRIHFTEIIPASGLSTEPLLSDISRTTPLPTELLANRKLSTNNRLPQIHTQRRRTFISSNKSPFIDSKRRLFVGRKSRLSSLLSFPDVNSLNSFLAQAVMSLLQIYSQAKRKLPAQTAHAPLFSRNNLVKLISRMKRSPVSHNQKIGNGKTENVRVWMI